MGIGNRDYGKMTNSLGTWITVAIPVALSCFGFLVTVTYGYPVACLYVALWLRKASLWFLNHSHQSDRWQEQNRDAVNKALLGVDDDYFVTVSRVSKK